VRTVIVAVIILVALIAAAVIAAVLLLKTQPTENQPQHEATLSFDFSISEEDYQVLKTTTWSSSGYTLRLVEAQFRSISWNGMVWTHKVIYLEPQPVGSSLVFLTAGGFGPGEPNATFKYIAGASAISGVPVAILTNVPNTPPGLDESTLLVMSNVEAVKTGDPQRSLLYPMAQAYIKAISLVEKLSSTNPSGFVISGGSKRGWTVWVVARHDPRVVALVPRSFNVANITELAPAQLDAYGEYTGAAAHLRERVDLENLKSLPGYSRFIAEYNPVEWIDELTSKPVLVLMGTNDGLFPPGLEKTYAHLHPNLHVAYLPNATHTGLHALGETWTTAISFVKYVEEGLEWPTVNIEVSEQNGGIRIRATFTQTPKTLHLLYATPLRTGTNYADYTESNWRTINLNPTTPEYTLKVGKPVGVYILAIYEYKGLTLVATSQILTVK